jgi:hypothetical protein
VFIPGKPFQPSLMFVGKTRVCPSEAPLNVILLSVAFFTAMLSVFMLSNDILNVVMLSVIMLNVVMLSVVAPRGTIS